MLQEVPELSLSVLPCTVGSAYRYCHTANTQTMLAISGVAVQTE